MKQVPKWQSGYVDIICVNCQKLVKPNEYYLKQPPQQNQAGESGKQQPESFFHARPCANGSLSSRTAAVAVSGMSGGASSQDNYRRPSGATGGSSSRLLNVSKRSRKDRGRF